MMETIRTAANNIVVKIIFAIIMVSFIFTGVGFLGFGSNSASDAQLYIAKVDGEGISREQFEAEAKMATANSLGDSSFIKTVRRNVLTKQIDNYLAYQFSQKIKSAVSNSHIKKYIQQQKVFFTNGKFDKEKYLALLAENKFTPESYAEVLRSALQQEQVIEALVKTSFVLPVDSDISSLKNQTRTVYATLVDSSIDNVDDINITSEDEQKYYDEHSKEFFKKERVKLKFIRNTLEAVRKSVKVSDDEVKQEYEKEIKTYTYPAKNAYSVIYVTDKEQADKIASDLASSVDFDTIAKKMNQDNKVSPYGKNGSIGWLVEDDSLPEVFKEAHLTQIGQVSAPIAADGGYVFIKLDGMKKSEVMDFDFAKVKIYEKLINQKVQQDFEAIEDKIKTALSHSPKSIEEIAQETGLEVFTTDWASYNQPSTILSHPEVRDVVFSNEMIVDDHATNNISELIPVERNYGTYEFVVQVTDYRPEGIAPFEEVKDDIHQKMVNEIVDNRFKSTVDNVLDDLRKSGRSDKVSFGQRYTVTRNSTDFEPAVIDMIFSLEPPQKNKNEFGAEIFKKNQAYIVSLIKVDTPERQDISSELTPLFINNTYYYLTADIRSKAKIEIMPDSNL